MITQSMVDEAEEAETLFEYASSLVKERDALIQRVRELKRVIAAHKAAAIARMIADADKYVEENFPEMFGAPDEPTQE